VLSPGKVKWRKRHKGNLRGLAYTGSSLNFGEFGLQAVESGLVTARQIEAARIAMSRSIKRGGRIWIQIFPDKPITKKPAETRMGGGKGSVEYWVSPVHAGRVLYEMDGVTADEAKAAFALAASKLPIKTKLITRKINI